MDVVVLHRREERYEPGSKIAVFPLHGPLLVRMPIAPVRYRRGDRTVYLAVGRGFAEVLGDRVVLVTPRVEPVPAAEPAPRARAEAICRAWREAAGDTREDLVGYR